MTELAITKCIFENSAVVNYYFRCSQLLQNLDGKTSDLSPLFDSLVIGLRLWKMNIFNLNRSFQISFNNRIFELGIATILLKPGKQQYSDFIKYLVQFSMYSTSENQSW